MAPAIDKDLLDPNYLADYRSTQDLLEELKKNGIMYHALSFEENADGSYTDVASGKNLNLSDNDSKIAITDNYSGSICGNRDVFSIGSGGRLNVAGSNDSIGFLGSGSFVGIQGTGEAIGNDDASNLVNINGNGSSATVNGDVSVGLYGSNQYLTFENTGNRVTVYEGFTGETISAGGADLTLGANASANIRGNGDGIHLDPNAGDYAGVFGQNQTVTGDSGNNSINLGGDGTSATVSGGGYVGLCGSHQILTLADWGSTAQTAAGVTDEDVTATNSTVNFGANATANIRGAGDGIHLDPNAGDYAGVFGQNQTVTGDSGNNSINLGGDGTSATVYGGGYVGLCGSSQTLTLADWGSTAQTAANVTGESVTASNSTIGYGANASANIRGNGDAIHLNPNAGDYAGVYGQNQTVTGDTGNDTVNLGGNGTSATVSGGGYVGLCDSNQTLTLTDGGFTTDMLPGQAGETVAGDDGTINFAQADRGSVRGSFDTITGVQGQNVITFAGHNETINISNGDIEIDGPTYGDRFWGDDDSVFEDGRYIGGSGDNGEWDGEGDDGGWDEGGGWDDPIVLNLSGQPVRTVAAAQAGARFDARDDGRKVALGWGTPGEGYLVHLAPGKQAVTQDADLVPSFMALRRLDANGDGRVDAHDPAYAELKVWIDPTGHADPGQGQLVSLSDLGIASLDVNATPNRRVDQGNLILDDSQFHWRDGKAGSLAGVALRIAPEVSSQGTADASPSSLAGHVSRLAAAMAGFGAGAAGATSPAASVPPPAPSLAVDPTLHPPMRLAA
ncbi:hypothetical protein QA634_33690 [Methylobacterium sp. CB376]|uniref:beta strand repeat-containing protein n=1 Tax=unclassified Methylobacterium TaxID=2615210 RepID=UPI0005BC8CBE|nr:MULTISPECIES: hypothetical protein [Methylobacterium]WFT80076.1 hypothetical protein QA634_33690 [Methylobacterium nodulans]